MIGANECSQQTGSFKDDGYISGLYSHLDRAVYSQTNRCLLLKFGCYYLANYRSDIDNLYQILTVISPTVLLPNHTEVN